MSEPASNLRQASYSTSGFRDRDLSAALDAIAAAGFTQTEIRGEHLPFDPAMPGQTRLDHRTQLQSRGLQARSVHMLGALQEDWSQRGLAPFTAYVEYAVAVGADRLVIHPIPDPQFVPDPDDPTQTDRVRGAILRSLDSVVPVAQKAGIRLLLENLSYPAIYPLQTMSELRPVVDLYPAADVGLLLDTGHAWTRKNDPVAEIQIAGSRLYGIHLQDVDRHHPRDDHWVPTHGGLDWDAIRQALDDVNTVGVWTFEVVNPRRGESAEELARLSRHVATGWGLA